MFSSRSQVERKPELRVTHEGLIACRFVAVCETLFDSFLHGPVEMWTNIVGNASTASVIPFPLADLFLP